MSIETSRNFRKITDTLTTSGTVEPEELQALRAQQYEVLINLLPDTGAYAVSNERGIVESQGIEYIHIPVDFKRPTSSDYFQFATAIDRACEKKVHVHCAANYRVSAFCSLYLVSRGVWSVEQGTAFIRGVWQPSEHSGWTEFIAGRDVQMAVALGS
jgi:protein tyrosine phosphatase (PTP) superfamily phosphohydrolase (DUF442 family)